MSLTYITLAITVTAALVCRRRSYLGVLILLSFIFAYFQNYFETPGVYAVIMVVVLTYSVFELSETKELMHYLLLFLLAVLVGAIILHKMPGFNNEIILNKITISNISKTYTAYFNVDKIFCGLILYTGTSLIINERFLDKYAAKQTLLIGLACILVLLTPALLTGYVKFNPKIPKVLPLWMLNNFLFVCFTEEVIFRGFLQNILIAWLPKSTKFVILAIVTTSIMFGLYHYRDGTIFMALSAIAGLFYGYAYFRTQRILSAMLVHFALNLTHILLFTYPAAL